MTSTPLKVWWHELNTWEPDQARHFYSATLGWDFQPTALPDGTRYWVAHKEGRAVGGIFQLTAEGALVNLLTAQGRLQQPSTVALGAAAQGNLWVYDAPCAEWVTLSRQDEILDAFPVGASEPQPCRHLVAPCPRRPAPMGATVALAAADPTGPPRRQRCP